MCKCLLNCSQCYVCSLRSDRDDESMSRGKAEELLMNELQYSRERAKFIVRQFDKNGDGKLNAKEMERFKDSVKQTLVSYSLLTINYLLLLSFEPSLWSMTGQSGSGPTCKTEWHIRCYPKFNASADRRGYMPYTEWPKKWEHPAFWLFTTIYCLKAV